MVRAEPATLGCCFTEPKHEFLSGGVDLPRQVSGHLWRQHNPERRGWEGYPAEPHLLQVPVTGSIAGAGYLTAVGPGGSVDDVRSNTPGAMTDDGVEWRIRFRPCASGHEIRTLVMRMRKNTLPTW